jgi:hypothetical protein
MFSVRRWLFDVFDFSLSILKETSNVQHRTSNAELGKRRAALEHSMFSVQRWLLDVFNLSLSIPKETSNAQHRTSNAELGKRRRLRNLQSSALVVRFL